MDNMEIKVKIIDKRLGLVYPLPQHQTPGSAGIDLLAMVECPIAIEPDCQVLIGSGLALAISDNTKVGLVYPRSGLATKHGIVLSNTVGVIDSDYRGEIKMMLKNTSSEPYVIHPGDRVAQLVVTDITPITLVSVDDLDETDRGSGGFGSTGN